MGWVCDWVYWCGRCKLELGERTRLSFREICSACTRFLLLLKAGSGECLISYRQTGGDIAELLQRLKVSSLVKPRHALSIDTRVRHARPYVYVYRE